MNKKIRTLFIALLISSTPYSVQAKVFGSISYANLWTSSSKMGVPLITENNNLAAHGFINEAGTHTIFGFGSDHAAFHFSSQPTAKIVFGAWFNNTGWEATALIASKQTRSFTASDEHSIINIPFITLPTNQETGLIAGLPKIITATVRDRFHPLDLTLTGLYQTHDPNLILLAGLHYSQLNEDFSMQDAVSHLPQLPETVLHIRDDFVTKNNYYGVALGARESLNYKKLQFEIAPTLALGINHQRLKISGQYDLNGQPPTKGDGLFAERSNSGTVSKNQFALMPTLTAKTRYQLSTNIRPFVSYDLMYLNHVIRPGQQIIRTINTSQNTLFNPPSGELVGAAAPIVQLDSTSFWQQGVSFGFEFGSLLL